MRLKFCTLIIFAFSVPLSLSAATKVAGWLPHWKVDESIIEATENIKYLDEVSPFAYYVNPDGTIIDNISEDKEPWSYLDEVAKDNKVKVIPSILWIDRPAMEDVLVWRKKRAAHVKEIVKLVNDNGYDGIDIDYENKSAETRVGFSKFLTELKTELKKTKKLLVCTIEARTPVDSRYKPEQLTKELLARIEYANDFKVIGKQCDRVRIMTYDQIDGDQQLNSKYESSVYRPIADIKWVQKVATLAMEDIPASKIYLGVATYGYKYRIIKNTNGSLTYKRIGSINYNYAEELHKSLGINPTRHSSGELYYTYASSSDYSDKSGDGTMKEYLVWFSDYKAIQDKVRIAKLYKLGGVAIFKVDGSNDKRLWGIIK